MERTLTWTNFYAHPRFWRHAIPWILMWTFLYFSIYVIGKSEDGEPLETNYTIIVVIIELLAMIYGCFYAYNLLYKKLKRKQSFFIVVVLIIIGAALVDHMLNTTVVSLGTIKGFWANMVLFPIFVLVAFGLKLAYNGTRQLFVIERLQAEQAESELKLLKSQINPHFLFNTLNNIYSTNLEDHGKANEIILELSELLLYQSESNKSTFTPLDSEISNIENYIDLEKIRVLDCDVSIDKKGDFTKAQIVPLLLLPFVENAFKYGTGIQPGKIKIDIQLNDKKEFYFQISNRIIQKKGKVHSGGIGLENVKKRLAIMYPNKHALEISNTETHFTVTLKMDL